MSSYHWQVLTSLAWFSSITHLTTLTSLRGYLKKRGSLRILRVICMLVMLVMLLIALLPTGLSNWPLQDPVVVYNATWQPGIPARCYFSEIGWRINEDVVISITFLATNYFTRTVKLFDCSSDKAELIFRTMPNRLLRRFLNHFNAFYVPFGTRSQSRPLTTPMIETAKKTSLKVRRLSCNCIIL
jgi:hypothetical protein